MNQTVPRAIFGAALGLLATLANASESAKLAASVKEQVEAKPSELLAIVERAVSANAGQSCEIVKSAIEASKADAATVAAIVKTASTAAPDQMRLIAQCSLAAAPDAVGSVQAVLSQLDPATGSSYSAKEAGSYLWAKDIRLGKAVPTGNPEHYKVVDANGVHLGDLHAKNPADLRVRATATGGGSTWLYAAIVPVPGTGWVLVEGGYRAYRDAGSLDFHLNNDEANPLNFPGSNDLNAFRAGQGSTASGGGLPPGPGAGFPPVVNPNPSTDTSLNPPAP